MQKISWWNTNFNNKEIKAVVDSIKNRKIGMGVHTQKFEKKLAKKLKVPYVVATSSGSVALFMALKVLGIKEGDEVIVPDRTFVATANAVLLTGAKVVLVDVNRDNTNIDVSKIEEKITSKTKAVIPVHLNGRAVDMEKITNLAKKHNLYVIEDAAQALFSKNEKNQYLGTIGDLGCFSLGLTKLISVGYGGFVVCHSKEIYNKLVRFRNQGRVSDNYDDFDGAGLNFKVSDINSSIGLVQLSKLNKKRKHLRKIYKHYKKTIDKLDFIDLIKVKKYELPIYIEVVSKEREKLIKYLNSFGIQTTLLPPSLHLMKHLSQKGDFENSNYYNDFSFVLPCGPNQDIKNVKYVIKILKKYKTEKNR